uniref:diphthine methyl ester synthase n=1 Tax=Phocoena sinus TaxID=42100 RepID=A0A8C9EBB4_PHOSS
MLYMIGLGLGDAKDITVKGLEVLRRYSRVYLEPYTSVLTVGKEDLEEFYGRKLILADREEVEQEADNILKDADISDVAFLVVLDPFGRVADRVLVLWPEKILKYSLNCCMLQFVPSRKMDHLLLSLDPFTGLPRRLPVSTAI